jgi:hypothetical protein
MTDILRKYKPGLAFVHLTAYDSIRHRYGKDAGEIAAAFEALDRNLAALLAAYGDGDVIVFSDHSQINVHTVLTPNDALVGAGMLLKENGEYKMGRDDCFFECCGGTAFLHKGALSGRIVEELREAMERSEGFSRFLTQDEMRGAGYADCAFGVCAAEGYCYSAHEHGEKANHGYTLDMPDYKVFYMVRGCGAEPGEEITGGSLLDIAKMVSRRMGLNMSEGD